MRANLRHGGFEELDHAEPIWFFPSDPSVDIAATIFVLPGDRFENTYFRLNDGLIPENEVACGDPISIIGLFRLHKGTGRNVPIVHSGHVAARPDPHERIPAKDGNGNIVEVSAYLVEAQTLDGLSGSPVWITRFARLTDSKIPYGISPVVIAGMSLLGVYQASWEGAPADILASERNLSHGTRVPVGMGLVVPASEIVKLIQEHPDLAKHKAAYIRESLVRGVSLEKDT